MAKKYTRYEYFRDEGFKWADSIVDKILEENKEGYYDSTSRKLNKVSKTCLDYALGNKTKTDKGKTLSEDDRNFYEGAYVRLVNRQLDIDKKRDNIRWDKKWGNKRR